MTGISILVLTKNEELDLPKCLSSVEWSDDIVVYDSYSTDNTTAIAESFGARVVQRHFDDWSSHQNWGLNNIKFRNPWVFYIDADEVLTPESSFEIQKLVRSNDGLCNAYRIKRKDFFMGRCLKHVQASPWYVRLFRPEVVRYERLVNPVTRVEGDVGFLDGALHHYPFSKGLAHWLSRHNSYSSLEAQQIIHNRRYRQSFSFKSALLESDVGRRRFHQKELFYRLPARPLLKFLWLYFFKRGFLDGHPGFTYALLQSIYEFMIVLKVYEIEQREALS